MQLIHLVGRFWVFLSHTAPGFQLWLYSHLCTWVVHWGLLLRLPWRTWVCPCEGQVWRWYSCLGHRVSGSTRYSGLDSYGSRKYSALEGDGNQYWPIPSNILAWRTPLPDREAWQATVYRVTNCQTLQKQPCVQRHKTFLSVAALTQ